MAARSGVAPANRRDLVFMDLNLRKRIDNCVARLRA
jgi:hypothetical protein